MDIPLNAEVECTDGVCGRSEYVLVDPILDQVTHLVVKEDDEPKTEFIVPVAWVSETISNKIRLHCTRAELEKMDPFIETTFIKERVPERVYGYSGGVYGMGSYYYLPYVTPERTEFVQVDNKKIPPGELAIHRGTRVEATDGFVGKVDEFVADPDTGHITHLVMREGHLWGKKDIIIPLSEMGEIHGDTLLVKLNKSQIEALPTFPLHRNWSEN